MASGKEHGSWGKDAVVQCASAPGLVGEVLDTETACEQALIPIRKLKLHIDDMREPS